MKYFVCPFISSSEFTKIGCPDWTTWEKMIGDGGVVSLLALGITCGLAIRAIRVYRNEGRERKKEYIRDAYKTLDSIYNSILTMRLANPALEPEPKDEILKAAHLKMIKDLKLNPTQLAMQHRNHAYMTLTFIETIMDTLDEAHDKEVDHDIRRTWQAIIIYEGTRYAEEMSAFWAESSAFQDSVINFLRQGGYKNAFKGLSEQDYTDAFAKYAQSVLPNESEQRAGKQKWLAKLVAEKRYTTNSALLRAATSG